MRAIILAGACAVLAVIGLGAPAWCAGLGAAVTAPIVITVSDSATASNPLLLTAIPANTSIRIVADQVIRQENSRIALAAFAAPGHAAPASGSTGFVTGNIAATVTTGSHGVINYSANTGYLNNLNASANIVLLVNPAAR